MNILWKLLQIVTVPLVLILLKVLRAKVIFKNDIAPQKGCLIISNHEGKLDPFFILNSYGIRKSIVNVPYQFPALPEYMDRPVLGTIIRAFGGFSIGGTLEEKAKSLFYIRSVLEDKGSVLIFPEARLVRGNHTFEDFQKGYTYLMIENTQVILAKLEHFHSLLQHFFSKKRPQITFYTIDSNVSKEDALLAIKTFYSK